MDRTTAKLITAGALLLSGGLAHTIRATAPGDPGPLGITAVAVSGNDSAFADAPIEREFLESLRAREVVYRTYQAEAETPVWLFLGYFDRQREGSQVHSPRHCYPGAGWNIEQEIAPPAPWRPGSLRALVVSDGVERRLVCYWYQTPRGIIADVFALKLTMTRQALVRASQDVVFANVSTPCPDGIDAAMRRIEPYARAVESELARLFKERDESGTFAD